MDDNFGCEIIVSTDEENTTIVAQAIGQEILNMKPTAYKLIRHSDWEYYSNTEFNFGREGVGATENPTTQLLVIRKLE